MKKVEPCFMCGKINEHGRQCSIPALQRHKVGPEDLKRNTMIREKRLQNVSRRKTNASK